MQSAEEYIFYCNGLLRRLENLLASTSHLEHREQVELRIAQVNSIITKIEEDKEIVTTLSLQVKAKNDSVNKLESLLEEENAKIIQLKEVYKSELEEITILEKKAEKSSQEIQESEVRVKKQEDDLAKMKSLFAKMIEFGNNYAVKAGAKVSEAMVVAKALPAEHIAHTKVLEDALKQGDKAAFDLAISKLPHQDINSFIAGKTLLFRQVENGFTYGIKSLLQKGANPNIPSSDVDTPMHMAASTGNSKSMKLLLDFGAKVDSVNRLGQSPLFVLIEKENIPYQEKLQAIQYLLLRGAKTDVQDTAGNNLISNFDKNCIEAKEFVEHPERLPDLAEFEQTIIGEV